MAEEAGFPLVVRPDARSLSEGATVRDWIGRNHDKLLDMLHTPGAVLFRGFPRTSREDFEAVCSLVSGELLDYEYRSNNRRRLSGNLFNSTEYPATETLPFHNEMSYFSVWPRHVWFMCEVPAAKGGATPLADSREVYRRLPEEVRERFERHGVLYSRMISPDLDLTWQDVFNTEDRSEVEEYCRRFGIQWEWVDSDRLRTRQIRPATMAHPVTREQVWFNQAHLFHPSALGPEIHDWLLRKYGESGLPRSAYYGDGAPIEPEVLDLIRRTYDDLAVPVRWEAGDVLAFDNVFYAHSRDSFEPPRRIVVGMGGTGGALPAPAKV
ncbi:hypothetical protein CQJ94_11340 [Glycomyces fuscus]|nr:hypothetical protein CQJ94_11340 [Glycomyces fuscus]